MPRIQNQQDRYGFLDAFNPSFRYPVPTTALN